MDRRIFLSLTGGALTTRLSNGSSPIRPTTPVGSRARIKDVHVDNIEEQTAQFRRMDDQLGGGATLVLVRAQVRHVVELLRDGSYTSSVGTRLTGAAGELMRLAGWLSYDAGQSPLAQRYWLAALHAAHAAGDRAAGRMYLASCHCRLGMPGSMVMPSSWPRRPSTVIRAPAPACRQCQSPGGDGLLRRQGRRSCRSAIHAAYDALRSTGHEAPEPGWAYWQDEANVNEQIGSCYLEMGDWNWAQIISAPRCGCKTHHSSGSGRSGIPRLRSPTRRR